jgi:inhibitor of cysteine peptidase
MSKHHLVSLISLLMIVILLLSACAQAAASQTQDPTALPTAIIPTRTADPTATSTPQPAGPRKVLVTDLDLGNNFQLNVGDALVVTLAGTPSTGYTWEVEPDANAVLQLAGDPVFKADSDLVGASGKLTLTLTAVRSGYQTLILVYHRPFEKETPPQMVFMVNVTVSSSTTELAQPTLAPEFKNTPTMVVNPTNGWKGWQVYTNLEYGFSFQYPPEWRLEEVTGDDKTLSGHAVQLFPDNSPDALMQVAFKHANEDMLLGQTGLAQGELIAWGKVLFMGQELTRRVLVFDGKHLTVLYTSPDALQVGDVVFNFSLNILVIGPDAAGLTEDVEFGSDAIVASVVLLH